MARQFFNSSTNRDLFQQPYAQAGGAPPIHGVGEIDLRAELDEFFFGYRSGIRHGYFILIRRFRRDAEGKRVPCTCRDEITRDPDPDCSYCFTGDALVSVKDNQYKRIDEIELGDLVLTDGGKYHPVEKIFVRDTDHLLSIKSRMRGDALKTTPEHVFFTIKSEDFDKKVPVLSEYRADQLKVGDWLVLPKHQDATDYLVVKPDWTQYRKYDGSNPLLNLPEEIPLNEDTLWMFGLYCAEGYGVTSRQVTFSLHLDELSYAQELERIFKLYFPKLTIIHKELPDVHTRLVQINNSALARWFADEFGHGCANKTFPSWITSLPAEKKLAAVHGVWDGDGHVAYGKDHEGSAPINSIGMTARNLVYQCQYILWENHIYASMSVVRKKNKKPAYTVEWIMPEDRTYAPREFIEFDDYWASKITSITHVDVQPTKVYDLRIQDNHSFIVNHTLVHNCLGEAYLWDEDWVWTYSTYGGGDGGLINKIVNMPPGTIRVDFKVFYLRYDADLQYGDKIVEVRLDESGAITLPFTRESIYSPQTIARMRSDNSRTEFIVGYCRENDALRLDYPR
jgi:intein/homing endonuclease